MTWIKGAKLLDWAKTLDAIPDNILVYYGPGGCTEMDWEISEQVSPAREIAQEMRTLVSKNAKGQLFECALKGLDCTGEILQQMRTQTDTLEGKMIKLAQQGRQAETIRSAIRKEYRLWQNEQGWITETKEDDEEEV